MCAYVANYQVVYSGRCQPGFEIKSISECSAAAKALGAPDFSVSSDGNYGSNSDPPFCYYKAGKMNFNAGNNKGICDSSQLSVCPHGPIGEWDVLSVTDMSAMFMVAASFNGDISKWDVSSVKGMSHMFAVQQWYLEVGRVQCDHYE